MTITLTCDLNDRGLADWMRGADQAPEDFLAAYLENACRERAKASMLVDAALAFDADAPIVGDLVSTAAAIREAQAVASDVAMPVGPDGLRSVG